VKSEDSGVHGNVLLNILNFFFGFASPLETHIKNQHPGSPKTIKMYPVILGMEVNPICMPLNKKNYTRKCIYVPSIWGGANT